MFSWRLFTRMAKMVTITRSKAWWWSSQWSHGNGDHYDSNDHTIHNLIWSYMCLWCLLFYLTILFVLDMWWMFCHDRIVFLKKKMRLWWHLPIAVTIESWLLWGGFAKAKYPHLSLQIVWVSGIHKHSVGLLIKAIKTILGFLAWGWELRHWMPPSKQESYRDMINNCCLSMSLIF
jgi:hypothetical protein